MQYGLKNFDGPENDPEKNDMGPSEKVLIGSQEKGHPAQPFDKQREVGEIR